MARRPKRKPLTLQAWWGKIGGDPLPDLCVDFGEGATQGSANYLLSTLMPILDELTCRGYDRNTFRFTISKPKP